MQYENFKPVSLSQADKWIRLVYSRILLYSASLVTIQQI